ncbi:hypothetical protein AB5I39_00545 [Sphingomonas sp. MMS24-J45]|uniref:hypothetical protein n=1 Tax=Sphingomonas sp. MMS24-J45 TaxID=3238806 RepID=UPI00384A9624
MIRRLWIAVSLAAAFGGSASAQEAEVQAPRCELHVWSSDKNAVTFNGNNGNLGLVGDLIDSAFDIKSPASVERQMREQLSPAAQEKALRDMDLANLFHMPGYDLIFEPATSQPVWTLQQIKSDDRLSQVQADCYAELAIVSNQFFRQPMRKSLRTLFMFREFRSKSKPPAQKFDATSAPLKKFPASTSGDVSETSQEIQAAFVANVAKFAHDKLKK